MIEAVWRQAGTTGRVHLVIRGNNGLLSREVCGNVGLAAWVPETRGCSRCRSCKRIARRYKVVTS